MVHASAGGRPRRELGEQLDAVSARNGGERRLLRIQRPGSQERRARVAKLPHARLFRKSQVLAPVVRLHDLDGFPGLSLGAQQHHGERHDLPGVADHDGLRHDDAQRDGRLRRQRDRRSVRAAGAGLEEPSLPHRRAFAATTTAHSARTTRPRTIPRSAHRGCVSEEPLWKEKAGVVGRVLGDLRLRGAYGAAGTQPGTFDAARLYTSSVGYQNAAGLVPSSFGNPQLKPERSTELELGFETSLLDRRMDV